MMRSLLCVSALTVITAGVADAQVRLAALGGYTSSSASNVGSVKPRNSFGYGAGIAVRLRGNVSFAPEVLYLPKGYRTSQTDGSGGTSHFALDVNYLEVPLLVRVRYGSHPLKVVILAGESFSFRQSCSGTNTTPAGVATSSGCDGAEVGRFGLRKSDNALMFGFGFIKGPFALTGRYDLGRENIRSDSTIIPLRNRALLVMAEISIGK